MIEALLGKLGISADGLLETVAAAALRQLQPMIVNAAAEARTVVLSHLTGDPPPSFGAALERAGFKGLPVDVQAKMWAAAVDAAASTPASSTTAEPAEEG